MHQFADFSFDEFVSRLYFSHPAALHTAHQCILPASNNIKGCKLTVDEPTKFSIYIDGVEADLAGFSAAIYKKIIMDAKQQRFQGFRPGTIPPQIEPTYRMYAMDECARETSIEAMMQNDISPFENARSEFEFENICIPPAVKKNKKKNKKKKNKRNSPVIAEQDATPPPKPEPEPEPEWRTFDTMKEAIDAGWKPGQSFRFTVRNCNGQQTKEGKFKVAPQDEPAPDVNELLKNSVVDAEYD